MNRDFINILREIRGTAAPGETATDGIWYELTVAAIDGNAGIYGDILAKYAQVQADAPTFQQAVNIIENLNIIVNTLPAGAEATSELIDDVWHLGIPRGADGADGEDGLTTDFEIVYENGQLIQRFIGFTDGAAYDNRIKEW